VIVAQEPARTGVGAKLLKHESNLIHHGFVTAVLRSTSSLIQQRSRYET